MRDSAAAKFLAVLLLAGGGCTGEVTSPRVGGDAGAERQEDCGGVNAVFRDFRADHPDFEKGAGDDRGAVQMALDADGKPVFARATGPSTTISGATSFAQWYRDVAGVNMRFEKRLPLTQTAQSIFVFEEQRFFPLDGMGWPGEERPGDGGTHNFHFTTEIHATFRYRGGEKFIFRGDDDLWVFANGKLALDLGGVHSEESATLSFDQSAAELGLTVGNVYHLDVFHAERHTNESRFRIETSIECLSAVVE